MRCFSDHVMKLCDVLVVLVIQELVVIFLIGKESDDLSVKG